MLPSQKVRTPVSAACVTRPDALASCAGPHEAGDADEVAVDLGDDPGQGGRAVDDRELSLLGEGALVTTTEATRLAGVTPQTIRAWQARGDLPGAGTRGRERLYAVDDVWAVEAATHQRDTTGRAVAR